MHHQQLSEKPIKNGGSNEVIAALEILVQIPPRFEYKADLKLVSPLKMSMITFRNDDTKIKKILNDLLNRSSQNVLYNLLFCSLNDSRPMDLYDLLRSSCSSALSEP